MAIPSNKPQNRILLVGGIVFALLAGVVVFLAVNKGSSTPGAATATVPVVEAAVAISDGAPITGADLKLVDLPQPLTPYYTGVTEVQGLTAQQAIPAGAVITPLMVSSAAGGSGAGTGAASSSTVAAPYDPYLIPDGYAALSIPTSLSTASTTVDQMTAGYSISPGEEIDILARVGAGPAGNSTATNVATFGYIFEDVPVLAVGHAVAAAPASPSATPVTQPPTYLVVAMPYSQAVEMTTILTGDVATVSGGTTDLVLKYVLRPRDEYGTWGTPTTTKGGVTSITFMPRQLPGVTPLTLPAAYVGAGA